MENLKITTLLGFTDDMSPMQATRVEGQLLEKSVRYNGKIYKYNEYIIVSLLEGSVPDVWENYQTYKNDGTKTKPKNIYQLKTKNNVYYEINKTQYEFACYICNNFKTLDEILARDSQEVAILERKKEAKAEAERIAKENKAKKEIEKEKYKEWLFKEAKKVSDGEKEVANVIFNHYYGHAPVNYTLIVEINNFNNEMCKQSVIKRLHNDNKASIKIFECLTGLKLPKGYKKRIEYLENLTSANFKGMTEFKPRKKQDKTKLDEMDSKNILDDKFKNIVLDEDIFISTQQGLLQVVGKKIDDTFAITFNHKRGIYNITHIESGLSISFDYNSLFQCCKNFDADIKKGLEIINTKPEIIQRAIKTYNYCLENNRICE